MARFTSGNTGGPGRPAGSGDSLKKARRLISGHLGQLVENRLADALQGDKAATDTLLAFFSATANIPVQPIPACRQSTAA